MINIWLFVVQCSYVHCSYIHCPILFHHYPKIPPSLPPHPQLCQLRVVGSGFLWHQIRCVVGLLFLIGEGLEPPSIIDDLLDVTTNPRKPQYNMAADYPLNLLSCEFPTVVKAWRYDPEAMVDLVAHYQSTFVELSIKSAICKQVGVVGHCV